MAFTTARRPIPKASKMGAFQLPERSSRSWAEESRGTTGAGRAEERVARRRRGAKRVVECMVKETGVEGVMVTRKEVERYG